MAKRRTLRRHIKKDYQRKHLKNPFFRQNQEGRGWHFFRWLIWGGLTLMIFLAWLLFMSPWLRLQKIEISGVTRRQNADIESLIWQQASLKRMLFFKQSSLLLFDKAEASQKLLEEYNFASVSLKKRLPGTLRVNISERPYAFIFKEGDRLAYADKSGYLITETAVSEEDRAKYFILENLNSDSLLDAKNKLRVGSEYLDFAFSLYNYLSTFSDLPLEKFIIDQEQNTLKAKFVSGPTAYFSTADEVFAQVDRLVLVKNEKIRDNFSRTNYIDLRYGSRVYINPEFP